MDRMNKELELLRLQKLPQARLVFSLSFELSQKDQESKILRIDEKIDDRRIVGVLQRTHDVDFEFNVPLSPTPPPEKPTRYQELQFSCQILYDPTSDGCYIVCHSMSMTLMELPSLQKAKLKIKQRGMIKPGLWRLLAIKQDQNTQTELHMCDLLIVRRQFHISVERGSTKRRAIEDITTRGLKRPKLFGDLTEVIFKPQVMAQQGKQSSQSTQVSNTSMSNQAMLTDLNIGDTAWVETEYAVSSSPASIQKGKSVLGKDNDESGDNYSLSRLERVGQTEATAVFACRHSAIVSNNIVAKVLRYSGSGEGLNSLVKSWKREKQVLEKLNHVSHHFNQAPK